MATEFRFNFQCEEDNENEQNTEENDSNMAPRQAKQIKAHERNIRTPEEIRTEKLHFDKFYLLHLDVEQVEEKLKKAPENSEFACVVGENTDLVPAVYEGGLKIWECAVDLIEFLVETSVELKNLRVLELGCGAGLPGIFALLQGAKVDFQDYNEEVIEHFTIPNVALNLRSRNTSILAEEKMALDCRFYSGDWGELETFINPGKCQEQYYDVILTAETIYNVDNYYKLHSFFKAHLRRPNGVVFLAAKIYYFGVGGGTRSFEEMVKREGEFDISVCKTWQEGLKREVLLLKWKNAS